MHIVAISDLHGHLIDIPKCDILLLGGDICPNYKFNDLDNQYLWLNFTFREWLEKIPAQYIVATAGNHDWILEKNPKEVQELKLPWTLLQDELVEIEGFKIYGSPWQLTFWNWAFNLDEPYLSEIFSRILPCDILLTHSPPYGFGDYCDKQHVGSKTLLNKVMEYEPLLHTFGHIHVGYGQRKFGKTIMANVAICDSQYRPTHPIMEFDL